MDARIKPNPLHDEAESARKKARALRRRFRRWGVATLALVVLATVTATAAGATGIRGFFSESIVAGIAFSAAVLSATAGVIRALSDQRQPPYDQEARALDVYANDCERWAARLDDDFELLADLLTANQHARHAGLAEPVEHDVTRLNGALDQSRENLVDELDNRSNAITEGNFKQLPFDWSGTENRFKVRQEIRCLIDDLRARVDDSGSLERVSA